MEAFWQSDNLCNPAQIYSPDYRGLIVVEAQAELESEVFPTLLMNSESFPPLNVLM